jgi:hypothetical protein
VAKEIDQTKLCLGLVNSEETGEGWVGDIKVIIKTHLAAVGVLHRHFPEEEKHVIFEGERAHEIRLWN